MSPHMNAGGPCRTERAPIDLRTEHAPIDLHTGCLAVCPAPAPAGCGGQAFARFSEGDGALATYEAEGDVERVAAEADAASRGALLAWCAARV